MYSELCTPLAKKWVQPMQICTFENLLIVFIVCTWYHKILSETTKMEASNSYLAVDGKHDKSRNFF